MSDRQTGATDAQIEAATVSYFRGRWGGTFANVLSCERSREFIESAAPYLVPSDCGIFRRDDVRAVLDSLTFGDELAVDMAAKRLREVLGE